MLSRENYQQAEHFQRLMKNISKWSLMLKLQESKRDYYQTGTSKLTDNEYDALERSLENMFGGRFCCNYGGVGFDTNNLVIARHCKNMMDEIFEKVYVKIHNARPIIEEVKEEVKSFISKYSNGEYKEEFKQESGGQMAMAF